MPFGTDHGPEMASNLDPLELRQAGGGDHLQGLSGGIRQEMEMDDRHGYARRCIIARTVAPAKAGAPAGEERRRLSPAGIPAFAGMTVRANALRIVPAFAGATALAITPNGRLWISMWESLA